MPAVIVMDAPESNHVASEDMPVKLGAYPVPLFAPIQFPVGKSPESIARNVTAVFAALDARKVRAPVDTISDGAPEEAAGRPMTDRPALLRSMASVISEFGTMPAVSCVLPTTFATRPSRRSFVPMLISATAPVLFAERPITVQAVPFTRFARVMDRAGREIAPEAVSAPVETLVGVMAPSPRVNVPEVVIGLPETLIPLLTDTATEVTVPEPLVCQLVFVPSVCNTLPLWVAWEGKKAFSAALAVVCPLPPLAIGSAVPE